MSATGVVGALLLGALATADGSPADPLPAESVPASAANSADDQAIADLVELAARQFDQRQLTVAAETLLKAIALSPRPRLFYNLAQVFRADGNCAAARDGYREFLAKANANDPTRDKAQRWLKEMQACVERAAVHDTLNATSAGSKGAASLPLAAAQPASSPGSADPPAALPQPGRVGSGRPLLGLTGEHLDEVGPAPLSLVSRRQHRHPVQTTAVNEPVATPSRRPWPVRLVGWGLLGVGVSAELGALLFQLKAKSIETDLPNAPSKPSYDQRLREGERAARWALWSALVGGALGAGGAATLIISRDRAAPRPPVAMLGWLWPF